VWAICTGTISIGNSGGFSETEEPAVIHLGMDGLVQNVVVPGEGSYYSHDIRRLFPPDVQEKIFSNLIDYRQLAEHLVWRREHPEAPPIIVLLATPMP
jgi:hypothetical protein